MKYKIIVVIVITVSVLLSIGASVLSFAVNKSIFDWLSTIF